MSTKRLILSGGDLPPKVNLVELQASLSGLTDGTAFASAVHEVSGDLREIHIDYPEESPPDLKEIRNSIKSHAPERDDQEEFEHRKAGEADLLARVESLERRMEALEKNGSRNR